MRTQANGVELGKNGKYAAKFATFNGAPGKEYLMSDCTSAAVFATEDEAIAGQKRALDCLEKTGRFPNLCELF